MMKTTTEYFPYLLMSWLLWAGTLRAQAQHWQCDPYDWEYDMTAYVTLTADGEAVTDYSNYEIAAFCGDECRGVATIQTAEGNSYCYLRIRSNQASGETITFKVYVKDTGREVAVEGTTMTFSSNTVQGLPSSPVVLNFVPYIPGDADGDGEITINDVIMAINASLGNPSPTIIAPAADMDGDGSITINDVIMIINKTLNK